MQEIVIIGADGQEHVFPAGFDPQKAAAIVRGGSAPASAPPPAATGFLDRILADNPALPPLLRGTQGALRIAKANPVKTGAMVGGALATGGASVPAQLGLAALGAAGGAGYGMLAKGAQSGDFGTPSSNAREMATEGAAAGVGQGIGAGVGQLLKTGGKLVYKTALRPSMGIQRDFGDVAETGLREGARVSQRGAAKVEDKLTGISRQVDDALSARDASRPRVAGYLPAAREAIPLGATPQPGAMPTRIAGAQRIPVRRPPTGSNGQRYAEHIEGVDPVESGFSSFLDETGHRIPGELPSPGLSGPGVMFRPMNAPAGQGAAAQMIAPAEIARRGLGPVRSELSDRALSGDAAEQLKGLEQRFLQQRNRPLTLVEAQRLKRAEQALADSAYRAEQMGNPVNGVDPQFHRGIARGTREAIEERAPEVGPLNQKSQELIGLLRALEDATMRNVPGVGSLRTLLGDFAPATASYGGIAMDRAGKMPTAAALRTALLAMMAGDEQ